jgi:U3 small nucleolar RNA-associated protein 23
VPLSDRFAKTLQGEQFSFYVTRTTLLELELLSKRKGPNSENYNIFAEARQFGLDECEIIEGDKINSTTSEKKLKNFSDASRDIFYLATNGGNNKHAYFVATQDDNLADSLREMPYVPLFRLGRAVLLLESPSSASRRYTNQTEQSKLKSAGGLMTTEERDIVNVVRKKEKQKMKDIREEEQKKLIKRSREEYGVEVGYNPRKKKAKGPNPLSCKKKKAQN